MTILERVTSKLDEYGLEIYNDYPVDDTEHVFYVENMILFVNKKDESIGVSFQATVKPDKAANMILILNELCPDLDVMESFIYDRNNKCLTGEKEFELIENTKKSEVIQAFLKDQTYQSILMTADCHKC